MIDGYLGIMCHNMAKKYRIRQNEDLFVPYWSITFVQSKLAKKEDQVGIKVKICVDLILNDPRQ
jgi:hypothetical protein